MDVVKRDAAVAGFVDSGFDEWVEEGGEGVVILRGNGIVFVIVAFGASGGGAEPDGSKGAHVLALELVKGFFFDDACFAVRFDEPVVAGSGEGAVAAVREEVARNLFAGELIEGHVIAEGLDDIFSVRTGDDGLVGDHAIGVGVTDQVEPEEALVLGILGRAEPFFLEAAIVPG